MTTIIYKPSRANVRRYAVPVLSVVAAALVTRAMEPMFAGKAPLTFFTVAVIVSAAYGLGPGLLATALSVASVLLLFREIFTPLLEHFDLTLFAVVCVGISVIMGRLQKANQALRKAQQALEAANQQLSDHSRALAQSNEELSRFAYSVAHDLGTPARSIAALTDLLVHRNAAKLEESSKECAALIISKASRIQAIIKGLLDYAAAVDKTGALGFADAGLSVQQALQDLEEVIAATGAEIMVDRLPAVAVAESQLVQVFTNLISNALKYCHHGRVPQVHISAVERGDEVVFCVRDTGIGLEMQYAGTIFGLFHRLNGEAHEGSGIGLALCKAVVEGRGGRIWVESEPGSGSSFYFTLPKAGSAANEAGPRMRTTSASA